MQQFREVSRTRTIYSTETHTSDFILNTFWYGKPVQFFQERCWVVVTGCQDNKSCSKVLNFQARLDDKIRCTPEETAGVVKPWKDIGSNKSLGCVFSEKPADWTNAEIAQWLERRTRDWKVAGSNPCRSGARILFSRVDYLCWLLFRYPFHSRVTAVARKRSRSFCQKCRWQVTVKHAYTLRMWLCMKWHGAWLYGVHRTCAETAAVSCGTSHASAVSTPLRWIFKNAL